MNEDRYLTQGGADLIKHFEGCLKLKGGLYHAYHCPANVLTIGWGHTNHHGRQFDEHSKWTLEECNAAGREDMKTFESAVRRLVTTPIEPYQFDALVSFTYNCGEGNLKKSTLLKKVNARDFEGAAQEFKKWNKANGKELAGLTRRRASESLLFQNLPDANYDGKVDPIHPPADPMPKAVDDPD
jgi:lysozyme